jgi:hypothetical protein
MVYSNNANIGNNASKTASNIMNRPFIIFSLFGLMFFIIIYVLYYYFRKNQPLSGFTYYSSDLMNLNPLFNTSSADINDCIEQCEKQPVCDGVTFNNKNKSCIGQYEGLLRTDTTNYVAWIKDKKYNSLLSSGNIEDIKQSQSIVTLLKSSSRGIIPNAKVPIPIFLDQFTFSFWINVKDWYNNYSYWRHIFHKGSSFSPTSSDFKTMQYNNWEQVSDNVVDQCIGAWLTPFQNNLRIAVTVSSPKYPIAPAEDANTEKCDCIPNVRTKELDCSRCWITDQENNPNENVSNYLDVKQNKVEYIDVFDIPTNEPTHIVISFKGISAELYVNNKYKSTLILSGPPQWNTGDLYVHNPINYTGELKDLVILPGTSSMKIINDLYNNKRIS